MILVVRKLSALEYYKYHRKDFQLAESDRAQSEAISQIEAELKEAEKDFQIITRHELQSWDLVKEKVHLVISAGGDGTVLATAAYNVATQQLNLKTDSSSSGVLCHDISCLKKVLAGKYKIESWTRQWVLLDGHYVGQALNEVCIGEYLKFSKTARYLLTYQWRKKTHSAYQKDSGIVIATGTGSTGWPSMFKPFPKTETYFKFKTIYPYEGEVTGMAEALQIKYLGHNGKFALDTIEQDFPRNSTLIIKASPSPLQVVIP